MVAIQKTGTTADVIPAPPDPRTRDVDPKNYVPRFMSPTDRRNLRNAGLEWAGTLGGFWSRQAGRVMDTRQAALNMNHFMTGDGEDRDLGANYLDDMDEQSAQLASFQNGALNMFLELIRDDLKGYIPGSVGQYLLMNNEGGVNHGTNWYGLYSDDGSGLYFAMGGFMVSYGALAVRSTAAVTVTFRMYVHDRYNWDLGKDTTVPGNKLRILLDDSEMDEINGMIAAPAYLKMDYFSRDTDDAGNVSYTVNDALLGALVESEDADNFDIVGTGHIQTKRFVIAVPPSDPPISNGKPR